MPHLAEHIAHNLATEGWYVGESVFSADLTARLGDRARTLPAAASLQAAGVGRSDGAQMNTQLRGDQTRWLDDAPENRSERDAVAAVHTLREQLNESLFLGAQSAELHFSRYAPGAFYGTHRDRFRDNDARQLSLVFYLNDHWQHDAGGELVVYAENDSGAVIARVQPDAGTMVCFVSARFPHEVLAATRARYSLTGWLRR